MGETNLRDQVLLHLAGADWVSGQAIAECLNVSRTAVWKHIQVLQSEGVPIEHMRGRGYRLSRGSDLIMESEFRAVAMRAGFDPHAIRYCFRCDSTNDEVRRLMDAGHPGVCVASAEQQLKGRGRMGREWISPLGASLYLSMGITYATGYETLSGLSLALGAVVADELQPLLTKPLTLKWPNDILLEDQKLAGILVEVEAEQGGTLRVVAGVGVNVHDAPGPEMIGQSATCLSRYTGVGVLKRLDVLQGLLNALKRLLVSFPSQGFGAYKTRWEAHDGMIGKEVCLRDYQGRMAMTGKYLGVDELGRLRLQTTCGAKTVSAGELSLRGAE